MRTFVTLLALTAVSGCGARAKENSEERTVPVHDPAPTQDATNERRLLEGEANAIALLVVTSITPAEHEVYVCDETMESDSPLLAEGLFHYLSIYSGAMEKYHLQLMLKEKRLASSSGKTRLSAIEGLRVVVVPASEFDKMELENLTAADKEITRSRETVVVSEPFFIDDSTAVVIMRKPSGEFTAVEVKRARPDGIWSVSKAVDYGTFAG